MVGENPLRQIPKSTILIDNIPYVWYNRHMSELQHFSKLTNFMSGMSEMFLPQDITKGAKKIKNFFGDYEGHQKNHASITKGQK